DPSATRSVAVGPVAHPLEVRAPIVRATIASPTIHPLRRIVPPRLAPRVGLCIGRAVAVVGGRRRATGAARLERGGAPRGRAVLRREGFARVRRRRAGGVGLLERGAHLPERRRLDLA